MYNTHIIKTDKFKTITIVLDFQRKNDAYDALYRNLLKNILLLKTDKYHSQKELSVAAANIYNPIITINTKDNYLYRDFLITLEFADEKYTEKGMNEKSIEFLLDYIFNPYIKNNKFDEDDFNKVKTNYIEKLKSLKNNPEDYSLKMCFNALNLYNYKVLSLEEQIKAINKITNEDLFKYYKSIFKDSLDIYVLGNIDKIDFSKYIKGAFAKRKSPIIRVFKEKEKIKTITEKSDNPQSKLFIAYKFLNMTKKEAQYTSMLLSIILGGGTESMLHKEVRENKSYCYYIYTIMYNLFSTLIVSSGISKKNKEEVLKIVNEKIEEIKKGKIKNNVLQKAKLLYKHALLENKDEPKLIINNIISKEKMDMDDIDTKINKIEEITLNDIINLANKMYLNLVYMLEEGA